MEEWQEGSGVGEENGRGMVEATIIFGLNLVVGRQEKTMRQKSGGLLVSEIRCNMRLGLNQVLQRQSIL